MKTRQKYKFFAEIYLLALVFSMSLVGIHFVITRIFNFTSQDSFIILIPVFLISFPAIIYGYHIGFERHYRNSYNSPQITTNETPTNTLSKVLKSCIIIFLIIIPSFLGLYLIIIKKSFAFGVAISFVGAAVSVPISKKLYEYLIKESRNGNPT